MHLKIASMRCPELSELPSPPQSKGGWPWNEESAQAPDAMPDGSPWPAISIVTPSYNQGEFIEETIRSVLLQGYPNLEYIIIDGGSSDGSVEIIKRYSGWLSYWVSEPDEGQSHAINKGMSKARGRLVAWLNSDDWLEPNALRSAAIAFRQAPAGAAGVTGRCRWWREDATEVRLAKTIHHGLLKKTIKYGLQQPSTFFSKEIFDLVGGVDQKLHYVMDKDLWLRIQHRGYEFQTTDLILSNFRCHEGSKTTGVRAPANIAARKENFRVKRKFWGSPLTMDYWISAARSVVELAHSYEIVADHAMAEAQNSRRHIEFIRYMTLACLLDPRIPFRRIGSYLSARERAARERR